MANIRSHMYGMMVEERGAELHVEAHGAGPTLVFAHGFGGSARNYRPQVRALSDAYRVVVFDARGHARSLAPDVENAYAPECFVADFERVIAQAESLRGARRTQAAQAAQAAQTEDALVEASEGRLDSELNKVGVGGLSMGAGIALRFAIGHPEDIYALVLASFPRTSTDPGSREWAMGFADAIERFGLDSAGERFVWGKQSRFDPKGAALIRQGFLEHAPHALAHILRNVLAVQPSPSSMRQQLEQLQVPTLLIAGEKDAISRQASEELASYLPNARLEVIENAGHVVNLQAPARFNAVLREFLAGARAA